MKITTLALGFSFCILMACSNSAKKEAEASSDAAATSPQPVEGETNQMNESGKPEISSPSETATEISAMPQSKDQSVAVGINPAHGEPGHRCDIAVGAPLNSPPSTQPSVNSVPQAMPVTTMPAVQSAPTPVPPPNSASGPSVTAPGMNPPHGVPGHDCSIAVGAPLK